MDDNSVKIKTMEYAASHKHSFKWLVKDDILHYDISDISFDSISNCFFGIKEHKLEELLLQMSTLK